MIARARGLFLSLAVVAFVLPLPGQFGGGGSGGGGGIPLSTGGGKSEGPPAEKPNLKERPVHGIVTDADGKPVAGAVVQLRNTRTQEIRSVITHDKGDYSFSGLSKTVDYEIKAVLQDHASAPHTLSTLDTRAQPVINLQIP
jgi:hypothetical protein